jgi:hypothetical protein
MKNNTKVRLHLSKQLFESLTKEIIKEAKANDGYTVAVKQPKTPKQSKSQATSPEVQKTDAEKMMGEVHPQADTKKMKKMKEAHDFSDAHNYTYRLVDGNCIRINPETQERAKVHHTYCNDLKKEMQMNVAEEGKLNEIDPGTIDWSIVAAGLGAIGLTPFLIDKIHNLWKKKFPKSFEKAQGLSGAIDRQASGNEPGDKDRQIKPGGF